MFLAITLLVPVLLLCLAELTLRVIGVGRLQPLFIPVAAAPGYLEPNPAAIQRFFPDPGRAPDVSIDTTWFPERKSAKALRIFVQGESSAAGFPYGRWASPAALLQQRLQRAYPDRDVEVINTAMAAVTSYVLLDFAGEIIAQRPDAVVIYTGHNEFLGVGGVGSSLVSARSPATARFVAGLRRSHLYRALETTLAPAVATGEPLARQGGTLMARVAAERSIPLESEMFRRGEEQFHGNLERLLKKYHAAGIEVFIGTLASNERDQPPFVSSPANSKTGEDDSALAHFARARSLDRAGNFPAARVEYVAAKDRDELRFRAPESFNALIRSVAAAHGATLVDVNAVMARAARDGIIGSDLMLEHVHPNVEGYFQLASAFYPALTQWLGSPTLAVDDAMARNEMPLTAVDRLHGEYRVALLKNDWPFVPERRPTTLPAPTNATEEIAQAWFAGRLTWIEAMGQAITHYQERGDVAEAARAAANLAEAVLNSPDLQHQAGRLFLRADQPQRAQRYLHRAVQLDASTIEYRLSLAQAQFMLGRREESIATLEDARRLHPGDSRPQYWLDEVRRAAASR